MAKFFEATFTASNGSVAEIDVGYATDSGGTFTRQALASATLEILNNRAKQAAGNNGGVVFAGSQVATTAGEYVEGVLKFFDSTTSIMVGIRASSTAEDGYFFGWLQSVSKWQLYRYVGGTFTLLDEVSATPSAGDHTVRLSVSGTGATVTLTPLVDGAAPFSPYSDTSGSRITSLGRVGIYSDTASTASTGVHLDSIVGYDSAASSQPAAARYYMSN